LSRHFSDHRTPHPKNGREKLKRIQIGCATELSGSGRAACTMVTEKCQWELNIHAFRDRRFHKCSHFGTRDKISTFSLVKISGRSPPGPQPDNNVP
jgi:hypothetical protein